MHDSVIKIGGIIRAAREANGVTQAALSKTTGIAVRTIIDLEKDKRYPTFEVLYKIINTLDLPADHIFRPKSAPYSQEQEQLIQAIQSCGERDRAIFMETAWAFIRAAQQNKKADICD